MKLEFKMVDDPKGELEARNRCNELWRIYQDVSKSLDSDPAKVEFLCGDVRTTQGSGLPMPAPEKPVI